MTRYRDRSPAWGAAQAHEVVIYWFCKLGILFVVVVSNGEMQRLDGLVRHCGNFQLPCLGAYISHARRYMANCASKQLVASVPEDRLQQAQRAIEAMSNLPQQQAAIPAAVTGKLLLATEPLCQC